MLDTFTEIVLIVAVVGIAAAALSYGLCTFFILASARLRKRSPVSYAPLKSRAIPFTIGLLVAFQLVMHFRMKSELAPIKADFRDQARMNAFSEVEVSYAPLGERDALLKRRGYVGIGKWWAKWCYDAPCVETTMIYLWVPFR